MSAILTRGDSLREYFTGAGSDGGSQTAQASSLGNYRSSTEAVCLGISITSAISGLSVDYASGLNALGAGSLICTSGNVVAWQPAGAGSPGPAVTVANGTSYVLEANGDPGSFIRVTCSNSSLTPGTATVTLSALLNDVFAMSDVPSAEATAGGTDYRGTIVKNVAAGTVSSFKRWIGQLGTSAVTDGGQLSGSGAGTITTTGSFSDWPLSGFAQVRSSGGTLKELVYYSSRTGTALTVPAAGRALLGTSATAGGGTDIVYAVPGVAIAIDTAGVTAPGAIQTIADQNTPPTSVSFVLGITAAGGLNIGTLTTGQQVGIWIKRATIAGQVSTTNNQNRLEHSYDAA